MYPAIEKCDKCRRKNIGYFYDYFVGEHIDEDEKNRHSLGISTRKKCRYLGQHKSFICNNCKNSHLIYNYYIPVVLGLTIYVYFLVKNIFFAEWALYEYKIFTGLYIISFLLYIPVGLKIRTEKITCATILLLYVVIPILYLMKQNGYIIPNTYFTLSDILIIISIVLQTDILLYIIMHYMFLMESLAGRLNKEKIYRIYSKQNKPDLIIWNSEELEKIW